MVSGLFAPRTFRPMDTSPHGRTFRPIDVSPHGRFAPWTPRPIDHSPQRRFAPKTIRPTDAVNINKPYRRAAATICTRRSPFPPLAPKHLSRLSRQQRSSSFPRPTRSDGHRCSRLTRQHGGEQSGLVTLTFDLESGVLVTCDVRYFCDNFGFPRPISVLDLGSMYATDRRQTDRQTDRRNVYVRFCTCMSVRHTPLLCLNG